MQSVPASLPSLVADGIPTSLLHTIIFSVLFSHIKDKIEDDPPGSSGQLEENIQTATCQLYFATCDMSWHQASKRRWRWFVQKTLRCFQVVNLQCQIRETECPKWDGIFWMHQETFLFSHTAHCFSFCLGWSTSCSWNESPVGMFACWEKLKAPFECTLCNYGVPYNQTTSVVRYTRNLFSNFSNTVWVFKTLALVDVMLTPVL